MESAKSADDAQERKLRKRLQNRINQRQRRTRKREEAQLNGHNQRPYQVDKWRYAYQHDANECNLHDDAPSKPVSNQQDAAPTFTLSYRGPESTASQRVAARQLRHFEPCPTQDHLLHLIQVNLLRGLFDNKLTIMACAHYLTRSAAAELQITHPALVFPGRAAVVQNSGDIPGSLSPTPLQSTVVHATCIDLVPFAALRDSLIAWEGSFDFAELLQDLIGNLVDPTCFVAGLSCPEKLTAVGEDPEAVTYLGEDDGDYTANRNGLILWGDAHLPESWEVTSGFLRKWGFLIRGCQGLIESSNRWRVARGEEPLSSSV
ncbi:hypothetical protein LEL_01098 [Akanthomyces lecanii RCEF 1005]|uniref:BZIP domain-containing protein n=1 Tax=Akanthomyces lecanii RCEF 1005 TaxID=1081108 RepID=A0A168KDF6_CORDF|nr:hypothetical protein LEL_01098 [Akanthomyces lecanii RCEF 1005]